MYVGSSFRAAFVVVLCGWWGAAVADDSIDAEPDRSEAAHGADALDAVGGAESVPASWWKNIENQKDLPLERVTLGTHLKWAAALWIPELAAGELGMLVYDPEEEALRKAVEKYGKQGKVFREGDFIFKITEMGGMSTATWLDPNAWASGESSLQELKALSDENAFLGTFRPLRDVPRESVKRVDVSTWSEKLRAVEERMQ